MISLWSPLSPSWFHFGPSNVIPHPACLNRGDLVIKKGTVFCEYKGEITRNDKRDKRQEARRQTNRRHYEKRKEEGRKREEAEKQKELEELERFWERMRSGAEKARKEEREKAEKERQQLHRAQHRAHPRTRRGMQVQEPNVTAQVVVQVTNTPPIKKLSYILQLSLQRQVGLALCLWQWLCYGW